MMAAARAFFLFSALICFFLVGLPMQWLVARSAPRAAHLIPLLFCRSLLHLVGVRVVIRGDRATGRPALLIANHISWIDILALGSVTPFCFLAKSEVGRWPVLSAFAEVQGTVFVDRRRRRSIPIANRRMAERLGQGRSVLVFPEGTTHAGPEPARFHSSHFAAARDYLAASVSADAVAIQPVALAYSTPAAAWIGDDALLPHLWRMLRTRSLRCTLTFCEPIAFGADADRKIVARQARETIVAALKREGRSRVVAPMGDGEVGVLTATSL